MQRFLVPTSLAALLFTGAIFGFFYAWICSTIWGLDTLDPRIAIAAMQAMNESVRNAVFAPAFFGTPLVCALAACLSLGVRNSPAALAFAAAALVYGLGGMVLTMAVNVPMNRALGALEVPQDLAQAQALWQAYSPRWQVFNTLRTVASGTALLLCGIGLLAVSRPAEHAT
ncbi:DUF1772 domain-containing protein [Antarctobacter heliothermus]|uniref:Uncharacterized membrane protein n=1 Tax=Antarctobacter heliothermus TaxID=74033 RepID=A0A239I8X6_9RHOB|nr:anthrone oxygenase family protein [Antarctobacter heliothermus]SNS90060.1 Uncharacterized membrane protein [Antarctobacter heliothermus]